MAKRRVVVVGGGTGGLELATRLGRSGACNVTLIDRRTTHLWKPLMHQIAAGTMDSYADEIGFLVQARRGGFHYHIGEMDTLDPAARQVHLAAGYDHEGREILPERRITYDELVLAVGSIGNDFGTPGVKEHCHFIDNPDGADGFRADLTALLARAWAKPETGTIRLIIVGGGPTGVELAAEVMQAVDQISAHGVDLPDPAIRITLVEASERILSGVGEEVAQGSHQSLENIGVEILTGHMVKQADSRALYLDTGERMDCDIAVWAAGVKGPSWVGDLPLEVGKNDRIRIDAQLRSTSEPSVHAIGDCAACQEDGEGKPVPVRAAAVTQQASYLAPRLATEPAGRDEKPFIYKEKGTLVSLAGYAAYGEVFGLRRNILDGMVAQVAYASLRRAHQRAILGSGRTLALMLSDTLRRTAKPKMKV